LQQLLCHFFCLDYCSPIIELLPNAPFVLIPIQFRRNQDFYITSNIQFNCSKLSSITTTWTILSCSSTCSNQTQLNQSVNILLNELFIPARTLGYGIYELKLTVTTVTSPPFTSTSSIYIKIIQSNIITNLAQVDATIAHHDYQQNLILNPGKYSIDMNAITFNSSVSY